MWRMFNIEDGRLTGCQAFAMSAVFFNCIKKRENKNNSLKTFSKHENISEKETAIIRIKMKRSTE